MSEIEDWCCAKAISYL